MEEGGAEWTVGQEFSEGSVTGADEWSFEKKTGSESFESGTKKEVSMNDIWFLMTEFSPMEKRREYHATLFGRCWVGE